MTQVLICPQTTCAAHRMTSCRLCRRKNEQSSALCKYHLMAKKNVEAGYAQWKEAYGSITWEEYLQRLMRNPETGQWTKEVAEALNKEPIE